MASEFIRLVQDKFLFLTSKYGFRCKSSTSDFVRYESDKVFVVVHFDSIRSYEIGVEVGQLEALYNGQERPFNLGEILRLEGVAEKENYTIFQADTSAALESGLSRLALLLSSYAVDYLQNDRFSFKRLSDFREKECNQYELETRLVHIRKEVRKAWENKDYVKVVELYKPVENAITAAEKKKLDFARKKIK